jgi:hypothetical protein
MPVPCVCCLLLVRGLGDGPITRPEEPYRVWHVLRVISEHQPRGGRELARVQTWPAAVLLAMSALKVACFCAYEL